MSSKFPFDLSTSVYILTTVYPIQGSANRKVAATNMNRASSRSHSVFTCIIESKVSVIQFIVFFLKMTVNMANFQFSMIKTAQANTCLYLVGISRCYPSSLCQA